ncbi:tyrosine recombinase XerC [Massiliimalia timonensis]|uniref:tyrosine recombinase XerC n=1 Tax=Massiliimalia timonensis TaxID=1987501 RepID=UPI001E3B41AD|nr:tyrosine recombinase XerC [Massiliimalia timonensis]
MYDSCPSVMRDFLFYMETIKGRSPRTVQGYYTDLCTFFRFMKLHRHLSAPELEFSKISIDDIDISFIRTITLSDVYEFLHYVSSDRQNQAKTRARKVSCIRVFFKYLTVNLKLLPENPVENLEIPSIKKSLPKYLTLEHCYELLNAIDGKEKARDYCMITLFLNCGMRLSELVGINLPDIRDNTLLLRGKGNKERIVYLNEACQTAIQEYIKERNQHLASVKPTDKQALFLSSRGTRLCPRQVERIVEKYLKLSGLSGMGYSPHKLRHTAATMMYQHGHVDVRVLQEILGHTNLGTTQIYTHVSNEQIKEATDQNPLAKVKSKK